MPGTVVVYDSNIMSESDLGLSRLKRWRLIRNWLTWGFLPGVLLISDLFLRVSHSQYSLLFVVAAWMVGLAYSARRVRLWPCPSCGKPLMQKGWFHNDFSSKCLHCGLSLKTTGTHSASYRAPHPAPGRQRLAGLNPYPFAFGPAWVTEVGIPIRRSRSRKRGSSRRLSTSGIIATYASATVRPCHAISRQAKASSVSPNSA